MFGHRLGLHVIKFPSGRFGYVGSIPTELGTEVPATKSALLGRRAHMDVNGNAVEWKFPAFDTEQEALDFAKSKGFEASVPRKA